MSREVDPLVATAVQLLRASILRWFGVRPTLKVDLRMLWAAECCARATVWARFAKEPQALHVVRQVQAFIAHRKHLILSGHDADTAVEAGDLYTWDVDNALGHETERGYCPNIPSGWAAEQEWVNAAA